MSKEYLRQRAFQLYLIPDERGNHKFSCRKIATVLHQEFNTKIDHSTVARWAKKPTGPGGTNWEEIFASVKYGVVEELKKRHEEVTEMQVESAKENALTIQEMNQDLARKCYKGISQFLDGTLFKNPGEEFPLLKPNQMIKLYTSTASLIQRFEAGATKEEAIDDVMKEFREDFEKKAAEYDESGGEK